MDYKVPSESFLKVKEHPIPLTHTHTQLVVYQSQFIIVSLLNGLRFDNIRHTICFGQHPIKVVYQSDKQKLNF